MFITDLAMYWHRLHTGMMCLYGVLQYQLPTIPPGKKANCSSLLLYGNSWICIDVLTKRNLIWAKIETLQFAMISDPSHRCIPGTTTIVDGLFVLVLASK